MGAEDPRPLRNILICVGLARRLLRRWKPWWSWWRTVWCGPSVCELLRTEWDAEAITFSLEKQIFLLLLRVVVMETHMLVWAERCVPLRLVIHA